MDWAESDSEQVTMNLQFAAQQSPGSTIRITKEDGTEVFSVTPDTQNRSFSGLILSAPVLKQGQTYQIWLNDVQQQYTGTDVGMMGGPRPGGMAPPDGFVGQPPEGMEPGKRPEGMERPELPEGEVPRMDKNGFGGRGPGNPDISGEARTDFYMNDKVNAFSGVTGITK